MMMALGLGAFGFIVSPTAMMALINHQCAACFFETDERYERCLQGSNKKKSTTTKRLGNCRQEVPDE